MKTSKKKITAPASYDPGKGRPKEYLAYLNWQEMEALKRLNGNNQEVGPRGLPSFPPGSGSPNASKSSSSVSGIGSKAKSASSKAQSAASKSSSSKSSQSKASGVGAASKSAASKAQSASKGVGASKSSQERGSGVTGSKGGGASTQKSGAGKGMAKAGEVSKARNEVQKGNLAADRAIASRGLGVKSLNVGPMGTRVDVDRKAPGQQIKGAIKDVKEAKPAARSAAEVMRAGPFGAPSYTGRYNPATNRFDAPPIANTQVPNRAAKTDISRTYQSPTASQWGGPTVDVVNRAVKTSISPPVRMDPGVAAQLEQARKNYKTVTGPGGMVSTVYSDPDLSGRTLGDTISDYASSIGDAVYGGIRSIGSMLPNQPVQVSPTDVRRAIEPMRDQGEPAPTSAYTGYGGYMPSPQATYDALTGSSVLSTAVDKAPSPILDAGGIRKTISPPQTKFDEETMRMARMNELEQEARRIAEMDVESFTDPNTVPSLGYGTFNVPNVPKQGASALPSKIAGYDVYNPADYENSLAIQTPSWRQGLAPGVAPEKTRGFQVEPLGKAVMAEEDVAPKMVNTLKRVPTEESLLPFQDRTYDTPYPVDENGVPIQDISEADLAKIRTRRRGEEYVQTPEEKQAEIAGGVASGVVTSRIPGARQFFNVRENIRDYQSRPSWEQSYIKDRASASAMNDVGSSRSSNERGIAALPTMTTAPAPTASTTGTSMTGTRPTEHYYWDLGLNIPSPTDKNYTDYQNYLSQRAAARAAMYGTT